MWGRRLPELRPQHLRPQHLVVEAELAVELLHGGRVRGQVDHGVDALDLLRDLVRQPAAAPHVDLLDGAAGGAHDVEVVVEQRRDGPLLEVRVEDDPELVVAHGEENLLWTRRPRALRGRRDAGTPWRRTARGYSIDGAPAVRKP